jgi:hypothetical protein
MCSPKHADAVSPRVEVACLDCPMTNIQHEMPSQGLIEFSTIFDGSTRRRMVATCA